ncbi:ParB/RepB/Spo0J family partition protein [Streptomyces sp. NPDC001272]
MAKHDEFDDFFPDDDNTPVVDTRADGRLLRVPLNRLAPNCVNPRTDFGTDDELLDLGKSLRRRQIQACPVVSRSAYLRLWPDHAERIGDVDYVLVTGERRYRGASAAGSPTLTCVADDGAAIDRKTFMEAVVSENVDRANFNVIEEAYAVQALVAEFGSNRAVAQHFERADGWVTQRILLTHLAPEVQELVKEKSMPLDAARSLGKLVRDEEWSGAQQLAWWRTEQAQRTVASAKRSAERKAAKAPAEKPEKPDPFYGRKTESAGSGAAHAAARVPSQTLVSPEASEVDGLKPPKLTTFPYADGIEAAGHLISKMAPAEFIKMLVVLNEHAASLAAVSVD